MTNFTNERTYILYVIQIFFLLILFYISANKLGVFEDEYLALTSNSGFFTSLDFNGGIKAGGSYSVALTSGPVSSLGGVIGWLVSKNLLVARLSNFIWSLLLNFALITYAKKYVKFDYGNLLIFSTFCILLVPWYYGVLYSIGEITSTILFFYSVILFPFKRHISLVLMSVSIFYGKFLLIVIFSIFYLFNLFINNEYKKIYKDVLYFIFPLVMWFLLVGWHYENNSITNYINDFIYFNFTNNQSGGLKEIGSATIADYILSYKGSEVVKWSIADKLRVLISPLIFCFIVVFSNISENAFKKIQYPIIFSTMTLYLWFWILSPTKWIRYSQHFLLIQLLFIFFLLSTNNIQNNYLLSGVFVLYISLFLNSYFLIFLFLTLFIIQNTKKFKTTETFMGLIVFILFLNSFNAIYELRSKQNFDFKFDDCVETLNSIDCYKEYMNQ